MGGFFGGRSHSSRSGLQPASRPCAGAQGPANANDRGDSASRPLETRKIFPDGKSRSHEKSVPVTNFWLRAGNTSSRARRRAGSNSPNTSSRSSTGARPEHSCTRDISARRRASTSVRCWPSEANAAAGRPSSVSARSSRCGPLRVCPVRRSSSRPPRNSPARSAPDPGSNPMPEPAPEFSAILPAISTKVGASFPTRDTRNACSLVPCSTSGPS
jgi:hypothetical protein